MTEENHKVNAILTDVGVVSHLRKEYGIQATTCIGPNPGNPNDNTPAIAVQEAVARGEGYKEFLTSQGFERVEHIGRGLFAYERQEE